jgi:hypothetical protein
MIAGVAVRAHEAVREDSTSKLLAELGLDIARKRRAVGIACVPE